MHLCFSEAPTFLAVLETIYIPDAELSHPIHVSMVKSLMSGYIGFDYRTAISLLLYMFLQDQ